MQQLLNIERLKREAKTLKAKKGITHTQALDIIAKEHDYTCWTNLLANQERLREEQDDDLQPSNNNAHLSTYDNPSYVRAVFKH